MAKGTDMTLAEFAAAAARLEADLQQYITQRVGEFREETGFAPSVINVNMLPVQIVGAPRYDWTVGKVDVDVQLWS